MTITAAIAIAAPSSANPPNELPYGDCTKEQHSRLNAAVSEACKSGNLRKCVAADSCDALLRKVQNYASCLEARKAIMQICFRGGNRNHWDAVEQYTNGLSTCTELVIKNCPLEEEQESCD